ncbi:50S ribosomal protein L20 [Patescibacteria group bacterium]|nr:50S ribosomal protein L20 [Patescibacteria group bacterium]
MPRVKRGVTQRRRHNKVLKAAKGYRGSRHRLYRQAKNAVMKAGQHAYTHRRTKKRDFRRLWIARLNAAVRAHGMSYSRFINALHEKKIALDRKVLADIAVNEPEVFAKIVEEVK